MLFLVNFVSFFPPHPFPQCWDLNPETTHLWGPQDCEASIYHCAPLPCLIQSPTSQASEILPDTLFSHLGSTGTTGLAVPLHRFYMVLETEPKDECMHGHFTSSVCCL